MLESLLPEQLVFNSGYFDLVYAEDRAITVELFELEGAFLLTGADGNNEVHQILVNRNENLAQITSSNRTVTVPLSFLYQARPYGGQGQEYGIPRISRWTKEDPTEISFRLMVTKHAAVISSSCEHSIVVFPRQLLSFIFSDDAL